MAKNDDTTRRTSTTPDAPRLDADIIEQCARAAHEVNRAYCQALGDMSQPEWAAAPEWQKKSAINGAIAALKNPGQTPKQSHESWLAEKEADGWKWGASKDPEHKQHPCMVPYEKLSPEQRAKDSIFVSVVRSVARILGEQSA